MTITIDGPIRLKWRGTELFAGQVVIGEVFWLGRGYGWHGRLGKRAWSTEPPCSTKAEAKAALVEAARTELYGDIMGDIIMPTEHARDVLGDEVRSFCNRFRDGAMTPREWVSAFRASLDEDEFVKRYDQTLERLRSLEDAKS